MLKHPSKAAAREPFSRVDLQKVKRVREREKMSVGARSREGESEGKRSAINDTPFPPVKAGASK